MVAIHCEYFYGSDLRLLTILFVLAFFVGLWLCDLKHRVDWN